MTLIRNTLLILLCAFSSIAFAEEEDLAKHWVIERAETRFPTSGIKTIELRNDYGNIRVRGTGEKDLDLFTVTQHHEKDPVRPRLQSHTDGEKLVVEVVYPGEPESAGGETVPGKDKRRIDVSGFVPDTAELKIMTGSGFAESKGHKGHLDIKTESGNIKIKTKGTVFASTDRGSVNAIHQQKEWTSNSFYQTKTGNLVIALAEDPNVQVKVDTAGKITTDYSINIRHYPGSTRKTANAQLGKPGPELIIESVNGDVTLSRMISMIKSQ